MLKWARAAGPADADLFRTSKNVTVLGALGKSTVAGIFARVFHQGFYCRS